MQTYPSPADIQEMKQCGYDRSFIADAEETLYLWQAMKDIQTQIENAFADVTLDDGIGLWQAQGMDDYKSAEECLALRQRDEKVDWSKIPVQDLKDCHSSLSFFDAEGMRFHLPAFLIADLRGEWLFHLTFYLCRPTEQMQQFHLLNQAQREAVKAYLNWIASDRDFSLNRDLILQVLKQGYWSH
ncbi:hypothetical protein AY605_03690 [Acinetobacter sp. SFD]|uniref:DUF6714 family protein n=1 Tax=Acinetobacter sp. SFD TaxID=1805635 RepID=UPI0007D0B35F|nr:DUF6714 family protein [Acinetobacter sp. SFD]OAL87463.1 hypothetical protein AY605_03690 [Acinetobacter sp. SFD]